MRILILGNGQLAMMLKEASVGLPISVTAFELPVIDSRGRVSQEEIQKWIEIVSDFDVLTYEIENIPVELLEALQDHIQIYPGISILETAQDRLLEKQCFNSLDIQTNQFVPIDQAADVETAKAKLGFPFLIKTRRFGYDGRGQFWIKSDADIAQFLEERPDVPLLAESAVSFDYEISQVCTRDQKDNIAFYPIVHNLHQDGILIETKPMDQRPNLVKQARAAAQKLLDHYDYVGTLAIEFFVVGDVLYANEMAPRVHNTGHWSIEGTRCSQFENHMRAISGLVLGNPDPIAYTGMINLIGVQPNLSFSIPGQVVVKDYLKTLRPGRKMGHINVMAYDCEAYEQLAGRVRVVAVGG